jgi:serine/threonine-protein kinase
MASEWNYTSEAERTLNQMLTTGGGVNSAYGFNTDWLTDYCDIVQVGEGGMGAIYKARNVRLNRWEAIKVALAARQMSPKDVARFRFEAEATASLSHPNIVQVYGSGEIGGVPYLALEFVPGGTLSATLPKLKDEPKQLAAMFAKITRGVAHAHASGILHRDLKPANVLIDTHGEPRVTDFGLAKRTDVQDTSQSHGTVGTPAYMAPEQARGESRLTTATDVFAIGAMLYEGLTGRTPFQAKSIPELFHKLVNEPPVAPRVLVPRVNRDLEAVCLKCLEKDPTKRYASAAELVEEFERVAAGQAVNARNPGIVDWLRQAWAIEPEPHQAYAWPVLVWFAAVMMLLQGSVTLCLAYNTPPMTLWLCHGAASAAFAMVIYFYLVRRFHLLPGTEKHSMMIAVGHLFVNVVLLVGYLPWSNNTDIRLSLGMYPALFVATGFGFFIIGTTHMGRFYVIGLTILLFVPFVASNLSKAPLLYGSLFSIVMLYWAYCLRVVYRR